LEHKFAKQRRKYKKILRIKEDERLARWAQFKLREKRGYDITQAVAKSNQAKAIM
jgi:hypothetical protein